MHRVNPAGALGAWLEVAAAAIGLSFQVVFIDDFYLPSPALDQSAGQPLGSVAIPGAMSCNCGKRTGCVEVWRAGGALLTRPFAKGAEIAAVGEPGDPRWCF